MDSPEGQRPPVQEISETDIASFKTKVGSLIPDKVGDAIHRKAVYRMGNARVTLIKNDFTDFTKVVIQTLLPEETTDGNILNSYQSVSFYGDGTDRRSREVRDTFNVYRPDGTPVLTYDPKEVDRVAKTDRTAALALLPNDDSGLVDPHFVSTDTMDTYMSVLNTLTPDDLQSAVNQ